MGAIDKAIGYFFPGAEFKRERYRTATKILKEHSRRFEGATRSRRTEGWRTAGSGGSINTELRADLSLLRERSRDLIQNNPWARKALNTIKNNTVGTGIRPTPTKGILTDKETETVKNLWWQWAETTACDWEGRETFYGLQKLVISTVAESGECLVRKRRTRANDGVIPVKLQVIEPDLLDSSRDEENLPGGGFIYQGVEFDGSLRRVAYWLFDRPPSESFSAASRRIPATDVLHIFLQERAGQIRGIPWNSSIMIRLRDFDEYEDAQLVRQKIAACFAVFVEESPEATTGISNMTPEKQEKLDRVEPGIIEYLEPGKKITMATPPAVEGYEGYSKKTLQGIAAGLGISYESLTGDLSNVNFSSGRMGWIEMHRNVQEWQTRMMIPLFCDPVWDWFIQGAMLTGAIKDRSSSPAAEWTPPRREMIDPVKEIKGMSEEVRNGFDSWQNKVRQMGLDPDEVLKQLVDDAKKFDDNGLKLICDARNDFIERNSPKDNNDDNNDKNPE